MSLPHRKEGELFTYGDYLEWNDDERWELINGVPYNMTPAPSVNHQLITGELYRQFANHLLGKNCKALIAPFDVRLPENNEKDEEIITVVQPDLSVVCDPSMLDEHGCRGGPDLVVEILSPSTAKKDVTLKLTCYERAGVKECWIVHPGEKMVMIYRREESGQFGRPAAYSSEDKINVEFLDGLVITLGTVFSA
ncbi:MAG: Uma2 family endonuclease [Candidatus Xenobiia bacterium LiM19]